MPATFPRLFELRMDLRRVALFAIVALLSVVTAFAQSLTTGGLAGLVKDQTGAAVAGATVTLTNTDNGGTQTATSNEQGAYQFSLLKTGNYTVQAATTGLSSEIQKITIQVGQTPNLDLTTKVQSTREVVEVTSAAGALQTENADLSSTFTTKQILELPAPGGDLTTVAFTVPGIVMSTGMGYGNFSSHGLPGISNLFTINGDDYNDAYLNLNNSGASNLLLGQNEVSEASVTQNGYSVQYGREAGAQANYVTKGGTNTLPRRSVVQLQQRHHERQRLLQQCCRYAASLLSFAPVGARISADPILQNKLFFYSDSEGLYYTLPASECREHPIASIGDLHSGKHQRGPGAAVSEGILHLQRRKGRGTRYNGPGPVAGFQRQSAWLR